MFEAGSRYEAMKAERATATAEQVRAEIAAARSSGAVTKLNVLSRLASEKEAEQRQAEITAIRAALDAAKIAYAEVVPGALGGFLILKNTLAPETPKEEGEVSRG